MLDTGNYRSLTIAVTFLFTISGAPLCETALIQAVFELDGSPELFVKTFMEKLDRFIEHRQNSSPQTNLNVATSLLQLGPSFAVHGNISDELSAVTIRFHFHAESKNLTQSGMELRDVMGAEDERTTERKAERNEYENWHGGGGIFNPIVTTVEPYLVDALNLVFHGIVSSVIGKLMEGANMLGDVRVA